MMIKIGRKGRKRNENENCTKKRLKTINEKGLKEIINQNEDILNEEFCDYGSIYYQIETLSLIQLAIKFNAQKYLIFFIHILT